MSPTSRDKASGQLSVLDANEVLKLSAEEKVLARQIGMLFKRYREDEMGVSIRTVADASGIHASTLYRIENGDLTKPAFEDIVRLAEYYRIPITEITRLVSGTGKPHFKPLPRAATVRSLVDALLQEASEQELMHVIVFLQSYIRFVQTKDEGNS